MTALCDWGGVLEVSIGLAHRLPGGQWDASNWDESEWEDPDTMLGDWLDVTCDTLDEVKLKAGSSGWEGVITRWEAATATLQLVGAAYDPRAGQWAGLLAPGLPVRVRWWPAADPDDVRVVFVGAVADGGYDWDPQTLTAGLDCTDGTADLVAAHQVAYDPPLADGDSASERVSRLADLARLPVDRRDIAAGGTSMQATTLEGGIWDQMLDVADADLGLLWVRRDSRLAYRPEGRVREVVPTTARLAPCPPTLDDGIHYVNLRHANPIIYRNDVTIARAKPPVPEGAPEPPEPVPATRIDDVSIARFRMHSYTNTDLGHSDDDWSQTLADAVIANGAWPTTAPERVDLDTRVSDDLRIAGVLLDVEPEQVFDVDDALGPDTTWRMVATGWDVTLGRYAVAGSVSLGDVGGWANAGEWDDPDPAGGWDDVSWALSGVTPGTQGALSWP